MFKVQIDIEYSVCYFAANGKKETWIKSKRISKSNQFRLPNVKFFFKLKCKKTWKFCFAFTFPEFLKRIRSRPEEFLRYHRVLLPSAQVRWSSAGSSRAGAARSRKPRQAGWPRCALKDQQGQKQFITICWLKMFELKQKQFLTICWRNVRSNQK